MTRSLRVPGLNVALYGALIAALLGVATDLPAQALNASKLKPEDWRADLQTLATELRKRHVKPFHTVTETQFDGAVAALDAVIPTATPDRIVTGFASIAALVGDGHTRLRLPTNWPRYAIVPEWFGCENRSLGPCELRVTRAAPGNEQMLGGRVVAIDGRPVADVHARLLTMIPKGESDGAIWATSTSLIQYPNVLHGLGIVKDTMRTVFTLEGPNGERMDMDVTSAPKKSNVQKWRGVAESEPVSWQRGNEALWWTLLPDSQTVYVSFNSDPGKRQLNSLTKKLMTAVAKDSATRMVVDLRRNGGVDYTRVRETLLSAIATHPVLGQRGHLYVLTGPQTVSGAMTNAVDFRKDARAILVGLPTGARPRGYQEGREFKLPKSKLVVGYATKYETFQDDDTPGVIPDQRVEPTWATFRAGKDPALEWVMQQPIPAVAGGAGPL